MVAGAKSAAGYSLSIGATYQMTGDRVHKFVSYTFTLVNGTSREVLVRQFGRNDPDLALPVPTGTGTKQKLIAPSEPEQTQIVPPHESLRLTIWFRKMLLPSEPGISVLPQRVLLRGIR